MPTTTNPTPAEIAYLERDIAARVMRWERYTNISWLFRDERGVDRHVGCPDRDGDFGKCAWSPWNNAAAALAVLKRLEAILVAEQEGPEPPGWTIEKYKWGGVIKYGVTMATFRAQAPGPHFGPAVCELARKVMEKKQ